MKIAAYVPDLMDRSRMEQASRSHDIEFVNDPAALAVAAADLVIVDLSRPGVLAAVEGLATRTIGFGAHVDTDVLAAARAAGCDEVLPRSQFFRRVAELLA